MRSFFESTEAGREYAAAYAAHYTGRDLPAALELYMKVIALHPETHEAGYSREQVVNIVDSVVPKQELLDAQIQLALAHFAHEGPPDASWGGASPLAAGMSV